MLINNKIKQGLGQNWGKHSRKYTEKLTNSKLRQYETGNINKPTLIKKKDKIKKDLNKYNIGDTIFVDYFDIKEIKSVNGKFVEYGWSSFLDKGYIVIGADGPIPCVSFKFKVRITKLRTNKTKTKYTAYGIILGFGKATNDINFVSEERKNNLIDYIDKYLINKEIKYTIK